MAYSLTYDVEEIGEFFGAEFACVVHFTAAERGYAWQIDIDHIDLWELLSIPTRAADGTIRPRYLKERRDVPAWLYPIIARNYRDALEHVAQDALDDARYADSSEADYRRDELISRETAGVV